MSKKTEVSVWMPEGLHDKLKHRVVDLKTSLQDVINGAAEATFDPNGGVPQIPVEGMFICFRRNGKLIVKSFNETMAAVKEVALNDGPKRRRTSRHNVSVNSTAPEVPLAL